MKQVLTVAVLALALGLGLASLHQLGREGDSLMVYCAAGVKRPVEEIARRYREEFGVEVQLQHGGTQTLLSQLQIVGRGDLFIAADDLSVQRARDEGLVEETLLMAVQYPVIAVESGNPKGIVSVDDLMRDDVRVAVGNPGAASIGKATRRGLGAHWAGFLEKVTVMKPTVTELAQDLKVAAVDAAVIWNSTLPQFGGMEAVRVPEFDAESDHVSVSILSASEDPARAMHFARYLVAPGEGGKVLRQMQFELPDSPLPGREFGD